MGDGRKEERAVRAGRVELTLGQWSAGDAMKTLVTVSLMCFAVYFAYIVGEWVYATFGIVGLLVYMSAGRSR